jgi:hypothetical protein
VLGLEESRDLLKGLAAELADDRDWVQGLFELRILVVGLKAPLILFESIDMVAVKGLIGSFHWLPPISRNSDPAEVACLDEHCRLMLGLSELFVIGRSKAERCAAAFSEVAGNRNGGLRWGSGLAISRFVQSVT